MLSYFSTDRHNKNGVSFHPIYIGEHTSFGQRCVCMSGVYVNSYVTVGAETLLPHDFYVMNVGGSTFGVPPVLFTSTALFKDILAESQHSAQELLNEIDREIKPPLNEKNKQLSLTHNDSFHSSIENGSVDRSSTSLTDDEENSKLEKNPIASNNNISRMQDIGTGKHFWLYVVTMILIQGYIPLMIGAAYGGIYFGIRAWLGELRIELLLAIIPVIYITGSILLMTMMKVMHICGGTFKIGTANFFSFR